MYTIKIETETMGVTGYSKVFEDFELALNEAARIETELKDRDWVVDSGLKVTVEEIN